MSKLNVAVLIPMTSKNQMWLNLVDCSFIRVFLTNFLKTYESKYNYRFYIGIDDNDVFFQKYKNDLQARLKTTDKIINFDNSYNGNPCGIWNKLYSLAYYDNNDYFFQVGDDIQLLSSNWTSYFINILQRNNNIGICGGVEISQWTNRLIKGEPGILENVFTSRKHYDIFKTFFNKNLKNWFSDDLITRTYGNFNLCFISPNIEFINTNRVGDHNELSRYKPDGKAKKLYEEAVVVDSIILKKFLKNNL